MLIKNSLLHILIGTFMSAVVGRFPAILVSIVVITSIAFVLVLFFAFVLVFIFGFGSFFVFIIHDVALNDLLEESVFVVGLFGRKIVFRVEGRHLPCG